MLWDALLASSVADAECWAIEGDRRVELSWGSQRERAGRAAGALRRRHGIRSGDTVAVVLTNSADAVAGLVGIWFAGGTVVSLPIIARGMQPAAYAAQLRHLAAKAGARVLLIEERFRAFVPDDLADAVRVDSFEAVVGSTDSPVFSPPEGDAVAFVQFSSGTTGDPRGVMLTPAAIGRQLDALADALSIDPATDRGTVWVPISHDMGLFGCLLLAWYTGMAGLLTAPERFLASPRTWLGDCADFRATITAAPPSALPLAVRAESVVADRRGVALRMCLVGGERISPEALEAGSRAMAGRGCLPEVLTPAYGLAEATLAVTVGDGEVPPVRWCHQRRLWEGEFVPAEPDGDGAAGLVSCGRPVPGTSIEIDGEVGEIVVQSPSAAQGYLGEEEATAQTFSSGGIRTSDLGLVLDGELYPVARLDDVVNVGARRVSVLSAEEAASRHPAVRAGTCVIVDLPAPEGSRFALLAETHGSTLDLESLSQELRRASLSVGGPPIDECVFLIHGGVPKTPSGKVQRFRARELLGGSDRIRDRVALR